MSDKEIYTRFMWLFDQLYLSQYFFHLEINVDGSNYNEDLIMQK